LLNVGLLFPIFNPREFMTAKIPSLLTLINELIAIPSISCLTPQYDQSNQVIIELLAHWCQDLGFSVEILPVPNYPGKFNLLATLGSGTGGLVLSGHTDTVPYDTNRWQTDPFRMIEMDNRLYGLGTADMKSFFALALTAATQFTGKALQHPLILLATANEESDMAGARALLQLGRPQARCAVIGEPTQLRPVRMHKGIFNEAIRVQGQSAHSSNPQAGHSALEGMYQVIGELLQWRQELQANYHDSIFEVPVPTLNLGHIQGGDSPNRICANCELHLDLRFLPGMSLKELRASLHQRVQQALTGSQLQVEFVPLFEGIEAMETPPHTEMVQIAEHLTQRSAHAVAFGTEAPYFKALGMDTIILGPGNIAQAHQPNEFIALNQLQPMINILTQLIKHFCLST
jgi:acetylornithine deacetylase